MSDHKSQQISVVPKGYTSVTPWIISPSSADLIRFLSAAFGAEEVPNSRITNEDGIIIHVVVKIGDALVMLFDARKDWPPTPAYLNLYVADVATAYQQALLLGARSVTDVTTLWFGEKVCRIIDPFGNLWWINERVEEIDFTIPEEVGQRASTPEAIAGIAYIQQSLDEALKIQKEFFQR
ncbi:VOC family protein [Chitinophaga pinensis]|uniref:Glyoxalase/bleomycin resistance protein/dioxygenase n=1 Tax=Chitinophaga pinensis (strain ATCC 43595 / DSM 2588 / LMG 13176 / NBRC 15968 / NCIMB 11800 / UQM 2034) TaxID=485918 RepID=A0A979GSI9_CHIPD|nr:VOC family protein [Chitinophaga pinensis]ACU63112.1 Glyoxalase/bleomycin resistance protein/dioxygenase [Chitinophaga pinensis DSM 2588]